MKEQVALGRSILSVGGRDTSVRFKKNAAEVMKGCKNKFMYSGIEGAG